MLKITGKSPPGEKLAAGNDCSSLLFNVFHHHHCCQSLLGIKLHKIQALGNKHQCLSAYVKSQFFLYSNFAWKLLLGSCSLQLSLGSRGTGTGAILFSFLRRSYRLAVGPWNGLGWEWPKSSSHSIPCPSHWTRFFQLLSNLIFT